MSWGYVVQFEIRVPTKKLAAWKALSQAEHALPARWPSKALASYFERQTDDDTLGASLKYATWDAKPTLDKEGDETVIRLTSILDRSLLYMGAVAPALLLGAAQVGGGGWAMIVNDGTTPFTGEDGWRLTVEKGELVTKPLTAGEATRFNEELVEELMP
jgi:hypothetical protein